MFRKQVKNGLKTVGNRLENQDFKANSGYFRPKNPDFQPKNPKFLLQKRESRRLLIVGAGYGAPELLPRHPLKIGRLLRIHVEFLW